MGLPICVTSRPILLMFDKVLGELYSSDVPELRWNVELPASKCSQASTLRCSTGA